MLMLLDRLSSAVARVTGWVVIATAGVMILSLILQVFSRYVLGSAYSWTEELAIMLFTWTILLAATTAIRDAAHVRLGFIVALLPLPLRLAWARVVAALVLVFCVVFAWTGATYVDATMGQVSAAMRVPIEWLHLAAPVCGVLGALHALTRLLVPLDLKEDVPS
ncbi:TRAP transporter small permease [Lutibaculum baratangense]|uniref:TRAP transporter small permease protein n=1 Tax=Lutibaculum baratangense AMV1 TaxID=631454 RepID=V4RMI7_9HYPH|nr:TRAP transporter small permease [Lutibaculum baratangense]ESR27246.1 TRAP-type C4-dicarboxylate transport system, small permease component [Lutibaculum baratangense AMV1]